MLEFIFRFLEREENERKKQISLVLSLLLIGNLTSWLYSRTIGDYEIIRFTDLDSIIKFILAGRLVLVLILFFMLWLTLNSLLEHLLSIPQLFLAHKLWRFSSESVISLLTKEGRPRLILKPVFERIGFIAVQENKLVPGNYIIQFAKRLKKAFNGEAERSSGTITTPATLVIQFLLTYWLIARTTFALPLYLEIVLYLFAVALIALDILLKSALHLIVLHKDEIISLIPEEEQKA